MGKKQEAGPEKSEPSLSFTMNVGHPEIPEGQFITMAKHAVSHLFTLCKDEGGGHTVGVFNMDVELKKAGFQKSISQFTFLLYELGVVKRLRRNGKVNSFRFFVLDPKQFNAKVTDEVVGVALEGVQKRMQRTSEAGKLRKRAAASSGQKPVVAAEVQASASSGLSQDHLAAMAEMVAEIERLSATIAQRDQQIAELQKRPTTTAEDTAAALIERFRKNKAR